MTKAQAGRAYLAAVAPADAKFKTFNAKAKQWNSSTTGKQAAADAKPVIDEITMFRPKLLDIAAKYPPVATNMKALVTAYGAIQGDLASLESVNVSNVSTWMQRYVEHAANAATKRDIVRSELGLPPAPSS